VKIEQEREDEPDRPAADNCHLGFGVC
jgi:hypothetical protein